MAGKRLKDFEARRSRLHVLKKSKVSVPRVLKTGGVAALTYGQETMGVAPTALLAQRRAVARCLAAEGSGDLDLRLALADGIGKAKVDPAFAAHLAPIGAWAEAVWCSWLPHGTLRELMRQTREKFQGGVNWSKVFGPAAACHASAARLGWDIKSAFEIVTDVCEELCLLRDSPAFVKLRITEAVMRWRSRAIEARIPSLDSGGKGNGPHLYPIGKLLSEQGNDAEWTREHKGALRSAVTGRQWTQQRLHRAGRVESKACQLCVATLRCSPSSEDPLFCGTLLHRVCACPSLKEFRLRHMPRSVTTCLQRSLRADGSIDPALTIWFTRALRRSPLWRVPSRDALESFEWIKRPPDGLLQGDVYTDGSLMDNEAALEGSCVALGWSFVILGLAGDVVAAARGCPPGYVDTIYGAELWAVQMV